MIENIREQDTTKPQNQLFFWAAVVVVGVAFFATDHDLFVSRDDAYTQTADEMEVSAAGGNIVRQLSFASLGLFGAICCLRPTKRSFRLGGFMAGLIGCWLAWAVLSLFWSADVAVTARRLIVLGCCVVGTFGLSKQLAARDFLKLAIIISTAYLLLGIGAEIALGTFRPFSGDYRFSGTVHPNTQGLNLVVLCLSTLCLAKMKPQRRQLLIGLFVFSFAFLILTKSRTAVGGLMLALTLLWTITVRARYQWLSYLGGSWCAGTVVLVVLLSGADFSENLVSAATLGRQEEVGSLTGRLPLWTELTPFVKDKLLWGYGYDSFWTADRIDTVSSELQWGLREAHSAYIDTVLSIGMIGASLVLLVVGLGMKRTASRYLTTNEAAYGFFFALLAFGLVNALTESGMSAPTYVTFLAACGLVFVAVRHNETASIV